MAADIVAQLTPAALGALASALAIGGPILVDMAAYRIKLKRYSPLIRRSFEIIDPLLAEYITAYGPSDVRFVINLTTLVLADGALDSDEVRFIYGEIEKRYSPTKAAGQKPLLNGTQEKAIYEAIKRLMERGERPSAQDLLTAAKEVRLELARAGVSA